MYTKNILNPLKTLYQSIVSGTLKEVLLDLSFYG